jgi:hypothetical protein
MFWFKKFFDFSISGILLTIGLGMYLTGLIIFGLASVSVFCFFSSVLCFGMTFYIVASGRCVEHSFDEWCAFVLVLLSGLLFLIGILGLKSM